jgi:hypothetical protein
MYANITSWKILRKGQAGLHFLDTFKPFEFYRSSPFQVSVPQDHYANYKKLLRLEGTISSRENGDIGYLYTDKSHPFFVTRLIHGVSLRRQIKHLITNILQ